MLLQMENKLSDTVVHFVLEVGSLEKGVYNYSTFVFVFAQSLFQQR